MNTDTHTSLFFPINLTATCPTTTHCLLSRVSRLIVCLTFSDQEWWSGGRYFTLMPVIWSPFDTSCSLKQVLSSQQLIDFFFFQSKHLDLLRTDKPYIFFLKMSETLWQNRRDWFYDRLEGTSTQTCRLSDSSSVYRNLPEPARPGHRCCFPSSSFNIGWPFQLCIWFPSRFDPTGEILPVPEQLPDVIIAFIWELWKHMWFA